MEKGYSPAAVWKAEYEVDQEGQRTLVNSGHVNGPDVDSNKEYKPFCKPILGSRTSASSTYGSTTSSRPITRSMTRAQRARRRQSSSTYADARSGRSSDKSEKPSELWLSTYPFQQRRGTVQSTNFLFHVHAAPVSVEEKPTLPGLLQRIGLTSPSSAKKAGNKRQNQKRSVVKAESEDAQSGENPSPGFVGHRDVLYLNKTFWREYVRHPASSLLSVVKQLHLQTLSQVTRLAVDVAVLRNKDEFETVARVIHCCLPYLTSFWAMITTRTNRPAAVPKTEFATLELPLPSFFDPDHKVRLGIHESTATETYTPPRGIVRENISRLNFIAKINCTVSYVLLAYFDDSFDQHSQGMFDVDINEAQQPQGSSIIKDSSPDSKGGVHTSSPPSKIRPSIEIAPPPAADTSSTNNQTQKPQDRPRRSERILKRKRTMPRIENDVPDVQQQQNKKQKKQQQQQRQQHHHHQQQPAPERQEIFNSDYLFGDDALVLARNDFPTGWQPLRTTSNGRAECGLEAMRRSWFALNAQLRQLDPAAPAADVPPTQAFRDASARLAAETGRDVPRLESGFYEDVELVGVLARVLEARCGAEHVMQLGTIVPRRHRLGHTIFECQVHALPAGSAPTSRRLWIWNGGTQNHYQGLAPK